MLLKLCELILSTVHFSGLHDGLILRTSIQRKKFTAICCAIHRNELYAGLFYSSHICVTRLVKWSAITEYINIEWIYRGESRG